MLLSYTWAWLLANAKFHNIKTNTVVFISKSTLQKTLFRANLELNYTIASLISEIQYPYMDTCPLIPQIITLLLKSVNHGGVEPH